MFTYQEPVERKLGQHVRRFTKNNTSHTKLTWDVVYDVPLISSLQQMLSDDHILEEVRPKWIHLYMNRCTTNMHALHAVLFPPALPLCSC